LYNLENCWRSLSEFGKQALLRSFSRKYKTKDNKGKARLELEVMPEDMLKEVYQHICEERQRDQVNQNIEQGDDRDSNEFELDYSND
jgi:hypothetical protein